MSQFDNADQPPTEVPSVGSADATEHTDAPEPELSRGDPAVNPEVYPPPPYAAALLVEDPPRVGDFWLDARLGARPSGVTYLAHGADEAPVMLIVLSEGAAKDAAARDRLAGEVNKMHVDTVLTRGGQGQDGGRLAHKFRSEENDPIGPADEPLAPWVALAYDHSTNAVAEADRILRSIDLSSTPLIGKPAGPDYQLHWIDKAKPGGWRLWPPPWPGRKDRAGWMTIMVSWLLMIVLTALALLIVVLIFQNTPPESPQPPVPTDQQSQSSSPPPSSSPSESQSGSESPPPSSASPSESSGSPSPQSASPTPGEEGSPSKDPSMMSSGPSGSAPATPTRNRRL